ncbi:MAG: hypothetical protein H0U50_06685 [Pyrinomonadaceae bacterium]|nr:hypothetical protein [Pyrinomonadaceae bacterium]
MKNTFLKTIGTALAILMLAIFAQVRVSAQDVVNEEKNGEQTEGVLFDSRGENPRGLEGSWDAQVTFRNCQTGAAVRPPFPSMTTFMQGGTMQEFGVGAGLFRGPGHGVWSHQGGRNFSNSYQFFRFNPDGTPNGKVIVRKQIEFRPSNSYVATAATEFYDNNNNLFMRGCATEIGTRFE